MKTTSLLLLILLSLNAVGQTEGNVYKPRKIQVGISFSPDISYRTLFNHDGSSIADQIIKMRNDSEIPAFGYHGAISVSYNFKTWVGLESGVQFSDNRYSNKYIDLISNDPEPSLPDKAKTCYNMYFIDIPLKINFTAGKYKVCFFGSVGPEVNIFLTEINKTILKYDDGTTEHKRQKSNYNYHRVLLSVVAGAGLEYKMNHRMSLRIEPVFRYDVINIIDTPITSHLWGGGLNIGYYICL
jgi:hypothetical protein